MAASFEKSVKGATKQKLAAPKSKYVEHILIATHSGDHGVAEIFRTLQNRLRDSTWTIVFKALIVVHLMIREGAPEVTLKYLSTAPARKLALNNFTEIQTQGRSILAYSEYLVTRAVTFGSIKIDYIRGGEGRMKRLTVDKGLLRETESVQDQINALLKCDFLSTEPENEITLTAFRMLTMDLLILFHVMNEGTINVIQHFMEMSKPDAKRALGIYKAFIKQTEKVISYLAIARQYEHATRLEIPRVKHAPTGLSKQLEDYLNDPDFDLNRRQYLVQAEAARSTGKPMPNGRPFGDLKPASTQNTGQNFPDPKPSQTEPAKPAPDLIDFFESIETPQNPPPQFQQQDQFPPQQQAFPQQQTGFMPQATGFSQPQLSFDPANQASTNPFAQPAQQQQPPPPPLSQDFTGAGFGGYSSQPPQSFQHSSLQSIPQNGVPSFQQQTAPQPFGTPDTQQAQSTNPFRQSMLPSSGSGTSSPFSAQSTGNTGGLNRMSTNPFAKHSTGIQSQFGPGSSSSSPFTSPPPSQHGVVPAAMGLQPTATGTNPFARQPSPQQQGQSPQSPPTAGGLMPNVTGSTNPFRQSQFVSQSTGQGWQNSNQNTMGGLEHLDTVAVFPRPGMQSGGQQNQSGQAW